MSESKAVDAHGHFVPAALLEAVRSNRDSLPSVEVLADDQGREVIAMPGLDVLRPMPPRLTSTEAICQWLDEQRIDEQVVGTWADLFGYRLDPTEGAYWSRLVNELQLEELEDNQRLVPLAILPLQDTRVALRELDHAVDLGYRSVTIGCTVGAEQLDDERLRPLWARLAEANVSVVLHPTYRATDAHLRDYGLPNTVVRPHDTDVALARMLFAGVFTEHPAIKVLAVHGGGSIPTLWGRLRRNHAISDVADPDAGRHCIWVDSIVYQPRALEFLVSSWGADRVMLGSDHPFPIQDPAPRAVVESAALSPDDAHRVLLDNACDFFGLPQPGNASARGEAS